jgi:hypothetical protein
VEELLRELACLQTSNSVLFIIDMREVRALRQSNPGKCIKNLNIYPYRGWMNSKVQKIIVIAITVLLVAITMAYFILQSQQSLGQKEILGTEDMPGANWTSLPAYDRMGFQFHLSQSNEYNVKEIILSQLSNGTHSVWTMLVIFNSTKECVRYVNDSLDFGNSTPIEIADGGHIWNVSAYPELSNERSLQFLSNSAFVFMYFTSEIDHVPNLNEWPITVAEIQANKIDSLNR